MDQIVSLVTGLATTLTPAAIALGVIGCVVGLTMGVIGYRHGHDVMRGSIIGMIVVLAANIIGQWVKGKLGVQ